MSRRASGACASVRTSTMTRRTSTASSRPSGGWWASRPADQSMSIWLKGSALVELGKLAMQPELGEVEWLVGTRQRMLGPTSVVAQIDASFDSLLLNRQNASAGFVQFVYCALAFNAGFIALRDNLCCQIKAIGVAPARIAESVSLDDCHVGFGIVVFNGWSQIDAWALEGAQLGSESLERAIEQTLQIGGDPLMRQRGRGHHHGDTIDQLPVLLIRPCGIKCPKQLNREPRGLALCGDSHVTLLSAPCQRR